MCVLVEGVFPDRYTVKSGPRRPRRLGLALRPLPPQPRRSGHVAVDDGSFTTVSISGPRASHQSPPLPLPTRLSLSLVLPGYVKVAFAWGSFWGRREVCQFPFFTGSDIDGQLYRDSRFTSRRGSLSQVPKRCDVSVKLYVIGLKPPYSVHYQVAKSCRWSYRSSLKLQTEESRNQKCPTT